MGPCISSDTKPPQRSSNTWFDAGDGNPCCRPGIFGNGQSDWAMAVPSVQSLRFELKFARRIGSNPKLKMIRMLYVLTALQIPTCARKADIRKRGRVQRNRVGVSANDYGSADGLSSRVDERIFDH